MNAPPGYDLEELLGDGGMGTVYRARQRSSGGRVVAIKRVRTPGDADLLARIQREAEILAALDHPHIVPVYEFVPDGQGIAIAMQYAPGGSLADRLAAEGRLDATSVVEFAAPIAQALASAHRRGVLHRDIKPGNILFTSDGEPLLSDFGVARWAGAKRLTRPTGLQLGTAEYLDPEVADGAPPDERSDLYSLGLVCYEALTGSPPYTGPTPLSVLRATDRGEYMPLAEAAPDCPPVLAQVVERAIARRPEDRFATAADFAAALRRAELAAQAPRVPDGRQPGPGQQLRAAGQPAPAPAAAQPLVRRSGPPVVEARPTRTFGPRPVASAELTKPPPRVPKALVWVVAAVLLLLPVVLVVLFRGRTSAEEPSRKPSAMEVITLTPIAPPPCAPLPPPLPQPGEKPLTGDPR